ncbi:MAG: nitrous oxide reductase family maturation protein NosD [Flavobacteriales bacterium]|nr:nitrous oxide reductase family maturation protein NosD [Flavobacteriales bacterium]
MKSIVLFTALFILANFAGGKTIELCSSCAVKTLKTALNIADSGDVIRIKPGVYNAWNIEIDKPVSIIGTGSVVLDGKNQGYILKIQANHVRLYGLTLKNVGLSYTKDYAAIYLHRVQHFKIERCTLRNVFFGILVEKSAHGIISGNKVSSLGTGETDTGNGIHLWHCNNVLIEGNHLSRLRDGIYFEFVSESRVLENLSENNFRYGLHFMFSNNDEYAENEFRQNGAGVAVMFSKFIHMRNNKFIQNWGSASYGLLLKEIYDAEIISNEFRKNTIGINAEGSNRVHYRLNNFTENGWAIKITGACYENIFERNNFSSNAFDVAYNSKMNDNRFHGNYWSDYSGYDLNRDGIGDVPHRPVKLFSYVVNRTPESVVLLRSLFVDLINFSEKVSPVFTPDELVDNAPLMKRAQ